MAKILKKRGSYLEENAKKNIKLSLAFLLLGFIFIIASFYIDVLCIASILSFLVSLFFFKKFSQFKKGFEGENLIIKYLKNSLDDSYCLINDIRLSPHENIDHIVIGPTGVFVIETKNYEGEIVCNKDAWAIRYYAGGEIKDYTIKSPTKQVKRNALKVKKTLEEINLDIWINAIVVFTSNNAILFLKDCSVPILKISELSEYIKSKRKMLSPQQVKTIGRFILKKSF